MAKKKSKDYEQEDRSKRSVKQAARKVISTSTTKAENKKSSTANAKTDQKSGTQATRSTKTGNSIVTSVPSLIPAIDRGTQLTHTAAQDSVVSKSKTNKLPVPSGQTTNHTNAERWYYEDQLNEVREEMERYDELCGGRMDLASLRSYYEKIHLYESILATDPNTKGERYMDDTFEQVLKGNYTDKVTGLGTVTQLGLSLSGLDLPTDARDAFYDWSHLKTTPWWQTALDTVALLPMIGAIKPVSKLGQLKHVEGAVDTLVEIGKCADDVADLAKRADDAVDLAKYLDDAAAAAAKKSDMFIDIDGKMDYNAIRQYSNEQVRHWYVQHVSSIHDSIDSSLPIAERARQAFEARNQLRTAARNMMIDQECRRVLDVKKANTSFDELLIRKMKYKGLTYEEALQDIYETAITTNEAVNKVFHIGG